MGRKGTTNTFNKGLMMDLNPLTTPNDVMTNCLNGTIITYNGNEYMLQSDVGNGRVETAYLPAGFMPVGMVEFGGIIYVVSYSPLMNKCQIGSFPSPERNIDSTEISPFAVILDNGDFNFSSDGAKTFYVQKDLHNIKLFPGDKFIVYASNGDVTGNHDRLYDCYKGEITNKMVELNIATITNEGKIVNLKNLRQYSVGGGTYIIPEMTRMPDGKPNLDAYRDLVTSPYNVFNNRVSGKLVLVAELLTIDTFNISIDYIMDDEGNEVNKIKDIQIVLYVDYESKDNVFMYAMQAKLKDTGAGEGDYHYFWAEGSQATPGQPGPNCVRENKDPICLYMVEQYDTEKREKRTLYYEITPCMFFGPIPYLKKSGVIQIDKIGTGFMELYEWRYYVDNDYLQLSWAMQTYPESGYYIDNINMIFSCYTAGEPDVDEEGNETPTEPVLARMVYKVSKKKSYNGSFTENIPFDKEYYKITEGKLEKDRLYFVTIEVEYKKIGQPDDTSKYRYFHRWVYTNGMWNKQFIDCEILDFIVLYPEITIHNRIDAKFIEPELKDVIEGTDDGEGNDPITPKKKKSDITAYGHVFTRSASLEDENVPPAECETASVTQRFVRLKFNCTITPEVESTEDYYDMFSIDEDSLKQEINLLTENCDVTFSDAQIECTGSMSSNAEKYLKLQQNKDYEGEYINRVDLVKVGKESPCDFVGGIDGTDPLTYNPGIKIVEGELNGQEQNGVIHIGEWVDENGQKQGTPLEIDCIDYIKCFCSLKKQMVTYKSRVRPVIYNNESASEYNITYLEGEGKFKMSINPFFSPRMYRKADGCVCLGIINNGDGSSANGYYTDRSAMGGVENLSFDFFHAEIKRVIDETWAARTKSTMLLVAQYILENDWDKNDYSWFGGTDPGEAMEDIKNGPFEYQAEYKKLFPTGSDREIEECIGKCYRVEKSPTAHYRSLWLFFKTNNGNYLPINFFGNTHDASKSPRTQEYGDYGYGPAISEFVKIPNVNIPMVLVMWLNQIYIKEDTSVTETCYVPDSIHYYPNYETYFNINFISKMNLGNGDNAYTDSNGLVVNLDFGKDKDGNNLRIPIDDNLMQELFDNNHEIVGNQDNDLFPDLGVENAAEAERRPDSSTGTEHATIKNNIIFKVTKNDGKASATYTMYESGKTLRDYYLFCQQGVFSSMVIYNNGDVDKSDREFGAYTYYTNKALDLIRLDEKFIVRSATEFSLDEKTMEYRFTFDEKSDITGGNFRDKFVVQDNKLVIQETAVKFDKVLGHFGDADKGIKKKHKHGNITGIGEFGPIIFHRLYPLKK